jgi:fatty acid desaturase
VLTSPHLVDAILLLTVLEGVVLARWRRVSARVAWGMLLPGMFLLLALRAALAGAAWPWVPAALFGALVAHCCELWARFRD